MTAFVDSIISTTAGTAHAVSRSARGRSHARRLLKLLAEKKNILITTHTHPDPDALASSNALRFLLSQKLKDAKISVSIKGQIAGGINDAFTRYANIKFEPWDEETLSKYDAIILLDTQPMFAYSPLPSSNPPLAVIDHHRTRARPKCAFCDVRPEVGATSSIVFSYFMELKTNVPPELSAQLLYAIESDLAGAAGTPGPLDNMALSSLMLTANTHTLYQMRFVDLPQSYYAAYFSGLASAYVYDNAVISHIDTIASLEQPAVIADFLLRYDKAQWALVTAVKDGRLVLSLRTYTATKLSAGQLMRRLLKNLGEGGGHRTKAGGYIVLESGSDAEIERHRKTLRRRLLRALKIRIARGQKLVPLSGVR